MRPYYYRKWAQTQGNPSDSAASTGSTGPAGANRSLIDLVKDWLSENWPTLLAVMAGSVGGGALGYYAGPKGRKGWTAGLGAVLGGAAGYGATYLPGLFKGTAPNSSGS